MQLDNIFVWQIKFLLGGLQAVIVYVKYLSKNYLVN